VIALAWLLACPAGPAVKDDPTLTPSCATGEAADERGACVPEACLALPEGDVYLSPGASGDGSRMDPAGDLLAAAEGGVTVVLDPGNWPALALDEAHDGLRVLGRCVDGVVIEGEPALALDGPEATVQLSGLTLTGLGGASVLAGSLELSEVAVRAATGFGLAADGGGATLSLQDVEVVDTDVVEREGGNGILVTGGADLVATRVRLSGNHDIGLSATGRGTMLTLTDVTVADTQRARSGEDGWGVYVADQADMDATGLVVSGNRTVGMVAGGGGVAVTLRDSRVEGTVPESNEAVGYGAQFGYGARIEVERTTFLDNVGLALVLTGGGEITLTDVTVEGVDGPDGISLDCLYADGGVQVVASGLHLSRCGTLGIGLEQEGTTLLLEDSLIEDPRRYPGDFGAALYADSGAAATLRRVRTERTGVISVAVRDATVDLEDVELSDGRGLEGSFGWGLQVERGAQVSGSGLLLDGLREAAVVVDGDGSRAELADVTVQGTQRSVGFQGAAGLVAQLHGSLSVDGLVAEDNDGPALVAFDGDVVATDATIRDTSFAGAALLGGLLDLSDSSVDGGRPDPALGGGVGVFASAAETYSSGDPVLRLRDVVVGAHDYAAVWIEDGVGGTWELDDLDLAGGPGELLRSGVLAHGNAVYARATGAWDGEAGLRISGGTLRDAAVAVLLDEGVATVDASFTGAGTDLVQQRCVEGQVGSYVGPTTQVLCSGYDLLTVNLSYTTLLGTLVATP